MTLHQFEYLTPEDQEQIINNRSVHLVTIIDGNKVSNLFQVDSFYIEISSIKNGTFYTTATFFDDMKLLEPYLDFVNINEVTTILGCRGQC
jgi:hypothetical protein